MKTLLTCKEHIVKEGVNIYAPDYKSFTSEGWETRGTMKQVCIDVDMDAYVLFQAVFLQLGLKDYIEMEYDGGTGTAFIRIIEYGEDDLAIAVKRFKEFADQYNKKYYAKED